MSIIARTNRAFTIVELLIVIVVIAILAAISIVAYTGIQNNAYNSAVQSDLRNIATKIDQYEAVDPTNRYPDISNATVRQELKLSVSRSAYDTTSPSGDSDTTTRNPVICVIMDGAQKRYGIAAQSRSGTVYYYTKADGLRVDTREWAGHQSTVCPRLFGLTYGAFSSNVEYVRHFGYQSNSGGWQAGW